MTHSELQCADGHSDFVKACKKRTEGRLSLEHSGTSIDETAPYDADGPYDVVISDMALMQLMQALMVLHCCMAFIPTCKNAKLCV